MKLITITIAILLFCAAFASGANAQSNNSSNSSNKQQDRPLEIKHKPRVELGNCQQRSGVTRLRVTFDKSAKVTNVEIASSSGCESFDRKAIEAAKKIKFKPAIKDGEPITVVRQIEYAFTIY